MVPNGEKSPDQLLGTSSGFLCCQELYKGSPLCSCAVAHGQCLSGGLCQLPRGYSFPDSLQLALALWEWALKRNIFLTAEHLSGL